MNKFQAADNCHHDEGLFAKPVFIRKWQPNNWTSIYRARLRKAFCLISLVAACLLGQTACSSMKVRLGMRVDLPNTPIASIEVSLAKGSGIAPGQTFPLTVTAIQPDGKVLLTEGEGGGTVQWKDLVVTASIVTVNQKGVVSLSQDPRVSYKKVGHVTVTVPSHPEVKAAELDIPIRYDVRFVSNLSGSAGYNGMNGMNGIEGISGGFGSMDPNNPSRGGDGTNGTNGSNGQDGSNGGNAPPVQVLVRLQSENPPLLEVSVSALGKRELYLVDPHGGSLMVRADGGPGGFGGKGGRGGKGGFGGSGMPNGQSGWGGSDGRDGFDGSPGVGGSITVTYEPQVQKYMNTIHLSSNNGPPPVFKQEKMPPLW